MLTGSTNPDTLRLASFNIQAGIGSHRLRHIVTHSHRYVVPHRHAATNLSRIAGMLEDFDLVALQEADGGSFRTSFVHQTQHIAELAGFPHWHAHITRKMGNIAKMTLGVMSRRPWEQIIQHRLPGSRHGRVALEIIYKFRDCQVGVFVTHLSLRKASRMHQVRFLSELINLHPAAILMGDLNCGPDSHEFAHLISHTRLQNFIVRPPTFPSWRPLRALDHIMATDDFSLENLRTIPVDYSDHLPITAALHLRPQHKS